MKLSIRKVVIAATVAASASIPAFAGIKYWDNPDFKSFDVGDYVQDGLVLHYDGIRNVGAAEEHSMDSLVWTNLASNGAYPMTWYSYVPTGTGDNRQWTRGDNTQGAWGKDGFIFDGYSYFAKPTSEGNFSSPATYTLQFVAEGNIDAILSNTSYLWQPGSGWDYGGVGARKNSAGSAANGFAYSCYMVDKTVNSSARSNFYPPVNFLTYANFIVDWTDSKTIKAFEGPLPTADSPANVTMNASPARSLSWYAVGGFHNKAVTTAANSYEGFVGTIHGVRFYTKVLSDEELLWNRVVDDARFYNRRAAIPVTNVVVSTTIPGIADDHFALDEDGFTFTAPAQRTVKGKRYVLNGYTLETGSGSSWGTPTEHDGDSCTLSQTTGKVRLTWNYERPDNEGQLVFYDETDYVTDGLELFFDGISNAGADAAHDLTATKWINLGKSGSSGNGVLKKGGNGYQGHWTNDGYSFAGLSKVVADLTYTKTYTVQILTDMIQNNQYNPDTATIYLFSGSQASFALATYNQYVYLRTQSIGNDTNLRFTIDKSKPIGYITAMQENDEKWAAVFPGTEIPSPRIYDTMEDLSVSNIGFGGWGGGTSQYMKGTIQSFRYYTNILTQAQLEQNRRVDNYRYFGIYEPEETNVVVQSTYSYLEGYDKCGPYEVEESYTFTAPTTNTALNGITYVCDGYIVEKRGGQVGWELVADESGNSYRYDTSAGLVRLTWKWKATSGLRTAKDYSFNDYSQAGLRLHYDGLLNAGVGVARNDTATKWVNLGSAGAAMNLTLNRHSSDNNKSKWGEKGYEFAGHAQFESSATMWTTNNFTAQAFVDAALSDHLSEPGNYIAATDWTRLGIQAYGYGNAARLNALGQNYMDPRPRFTPENGRLQYVTAIQNDTAKTTTIFPGVSAPTSGSATDGFRQYTTCSNEYTVAFRLGGWGGGAHTDQCLTGTLNNFRYYDRVLTEEELVRNRNVDSARYFGELGVTNVIVAIDADSTGITLPENIATNTAYFVEGTYEFTASASGSNILGYRLSVPDGNGGWTASQSFVEGASYTYDSGSPATVLLEWRIQKPFTLIFR